MSTTGGQEVNYAMQLEFDEVKAGKLSGRIYLCVLDRKKSFIRGTFVANVVRSPFADSPQQPMRGFVSPPKDIAPDAAGWTLELAGATIPDTPATGRLHGFAFKVELARMRVGATFDQTGKQVGDSLLLELREGQDFFADRQISVSLPELSLARLSGRTIRWPSDDPKANRPLVNMEWKVAGQHFAEHATVDKFVMRIEFGELNGGQLPGRIYFCVLDQEKSLVRGSFVATVQKSSGVPAGSRRLPPVTRPPRI